MSNSSPLNVIVRTIKFLLFRNYLVHFNGLIIIYAFTMKEIRLRGDSREYSALAGETWEVKE